MDIFYIAGSIGATARGIGILKALGHGLLVTQWTALPEEEGVEWFGGMVRQRGCYIWDSVPWRTNAEGLHLSMGELPFEVDHVLTVETPIIARVPTPRDIQRAEKWWQHPPPIMRMVDGRRVAEYPAPSDTRVLACAGGKRREWMEFREVVETLEPGARLALPDHTFYWPAPALMATADGVWGGYQVQQEWMAVRGQQAADGAEEVATVLRRVV